MKKTNFVLMIIGLIIVSFAIFPPLIIAEVHGVAWRIIIALLGCFSFTSGIYKTVHKSNQSNC